MSLLREVIVQHQALLARVVACYERNEALQQELLQEVTLAIWQALPRFNKQSSIKTYILKIAHNRAVSHVIQQTKHKDVVDLGEQSVDDFDDQNNLSPEQSSSQAQQVNALLQAVRKLPIKPRQVVTLSLEGLSYQEISEVTGMTTSLVGATLSRAKQTLKQVMKNG